jgi:ATP-dependent 26S proteasome regulatory subunit
MNSKQTFENIRDLIKANYPLIYAVTTEYNRSLSYIRDLSTKNGYKFQVWDCVTGLQEHKKVDKNIKLQEVAGCQDYIGLLDYIIKTTDEKESQGEKEIFLIEDLHRYFDQVETFTRLRKLAEKLRFYDKHIILTGPFIKIPDELEKFVTVVNIPLPDRKDLEKNLDYISKGEKIDDDLKKYFIDSALGMTDMEAFLAFQLAKQKVGLQTKEAAQIISMEKEQIIKKSGILDYYQVNQDLESSLGGLDNLKDWLTKREKSFQRKAKDFGLQEPKGILLVGVPGCGKSLTAKCVAASWKQPLLKLDIGKVFQAEVGASENNIRQAIETAEAVAPCVLWIDEIEKGLNTGGGEKDGGTNSRVFSTILTWMQEKTKPVFVVATANNIQALPPELLRKGRFDEIFFVDLPTKKERENIFKIHLDRTKRSSIVDFDEIVEKSKYFNGAEIEECVKEAMFIAYDENPDVEKITLRHLIEAIEPIIPLAMTMQQQINFLRQFGKSKRARPASKEFNEEEITVEVGKTVLKTKAEKDFDIYSE